MYSKTAEVVVEESGGGGMCWLNAHCLTVMFLPWRNVQHRLSNLMFNTLISSICNLPVVVFHFKISNVQCLLSDNFDRTNSNCSMNKDPPCWQNKE